MHNGSSVLNSTENSAKILLPTRYSRQLAERREAQEIRQLTSFGLTLGWLFTLLGSFCWFCVISPIDLFWYGLMIAGLLLLFFALVLPQALCWPYRLWMGVAHLQGGLVMTAVLSVVYVTLVWPLGVWERRRRGGAHPFYTWDHRPPATSTGWERLLSAEQPAMTANAGSRSPVWLLVEALGFFIRRGHYVALPVLLILLMLGLVLFFVQSSALAPLIYTVF